MRERERAVYRKFDVVVVVTYKKQIIGCRRKLGKAYLLEVLIIGDLLFRLH